MVSISGAALKNLALSTAGAGTRSCKARRWFSDLLWIAFPGPSEAAVARKAAAALGCSDRQAKNWLRCENDAPVRAVLATIAIAGAEVALKKLEGK